MEFRQLRYFVTVAETLNFTRASEKLHIAQPAVSRQVRQLEQEIGVDLLIRGKRRILLTDAGRVLLEQAKILLAHAEHAADAARRAQKTERKLVRVGIAVGLGERVNTVLIQHAKSFPDVEVQCRNIVSSHQNEALKQLRIDVGFLRPPVDLEHFKSEVLFTEPLLVLIPETNPLARRKSVRLRQLAGMLLLLHRRSVSIGLYDKILELYREADITPEIEHTLAAPYEEAGGMLVASGKGIYIGVGAALEHPVFSRGVKAVRLDEPGASIDVHVAWRRDESSGALMDFLQSVRTVFKISTKDS